MEPRILIATPVAETKLYVWSEWVESIRNQDTSIAYDVLLVDNTDKPTAGYLDYLREWARSMPFGPTHKVRLKRFGMDVNGLIFANHLMKVGYSERLIWNLLNGEEDYEAEDYDPCPEPIDYAARWLSYTHLLSLECDVIMPPHAIRTLMASGQQWAAAWMLTRTITDPRYPGETRKLPLLWHSLDLEHYRTLNETAEAKGMDKFYYLASLGYYEPPGPQPFPCVVTHLGCTLIDCEVIRSVPFHFTTNGGDVTYSWAVQEHGIQPMCVPAVVCDHIAEIDRPDHVEPWSTARPLAKEA